MSEIAVKRRKRYIDHTRDKSKRTYLVHGPSNPSYKCKILGDFGSKYAKSEPTKDCRNDPSNRNKFNRQQDNDTIVNHAVDERLLKENNKVSAED